MQIALKEHTRPQFHRQLVCYNRQLHPVFEAHLSGHKCRSLRSEIQLYTRHRHPSQTAIPSSPTTSQSPSDPFRPHP